MKRKYILYGVFAALLGASCVEDEGNNTLSPINELQVEGIEDEYFKIGFQERLTLPITIKGALTGADESKFDFKWFLCNNAPDEASHRHQVIAKTKDLDYPVDIASGTYYLYFSAVEKATGMKWEKSTKLNVLSPFVQGFYLWGDKEDGSCGLDFISMIQNRDTTVMHDIFTNPTGMKHAKNLIFTGTYTDPATALWALSEDGYASIEHRSSLEKFGVLENERLDKIIFPTIEVTRPFQLVDIYPHPYGKSNTCTSRSWRILLTQGDAYFCTMFSGESYGNPINRYSTTSKELYKPSPYVFHKNSNYINAVALFDETNHCFAVQNGAYYSGVSHTVKPIDSPNPFFFDQTKYNPVRNLVYGENADNYSYALMNDANGDYFIYKFMVNKYGNRGLRKAEAYQVDKSVAKDFDKATHYAFFAKQRIVLYAVGAHLWAYDYRRNVAKEVYTATGEITYLAMDFASNETPTDFIFATYSDAEKGTVYKYMIEDNQNDIVVKPHVYKTKSYPWKTNLKVKKIEYRNSKI